MFLLYSYSRQPPFLSLSKQQKGSEGVDWELEVEKLYEDRKNVEGMVTCIAEIIAEWLQPN